MVSDTLSVSSFDTVVRDVAQEVGLMMKDAGKGELLFRFFVTISAYV